ncbi:MAG: STAS domain-containing protein [Synergistaceae bacterium]|nr:STAS domain-containing protein [Synergistaceae bacterium]
MLHEESKLTNLRKEVNPVFLTARGCLKLSAENGDTKAQKLLDVLKFDSLNTGKEVKFPKEFENIRKQLMLGFSVIIEMRFETTENYFRHSGIHQLMDLPCGYTSRGLRLAGKNFRYYGFDLPAVIDEFLPAVTNFLSPDDMKSIHYSSVDATNYDSLRNALKGAEGEILITTEGLLMYFTQQELEEVFSNIHKILDEFGGRWITLDRQLAIKTDEIQKVILENSPESSSEIVRKSFKASSLDIPDNVLFAEDEAKTRKFISDMGFDLTLEPVKKYIPERLHSLDELPDEHKSAIRRILESMCYYVMTPRRTGSLNANHSEGKKFSLRYGIIGGTLKFTLSGRLDTISAPELLDTFRSKHDIQNVELDMHDLDYISSAGLRVLLIIYKALPAGGFKMQNIKPAVQEILETTGFDSILRG